jgi:DNA polymerase III delta prime subunit
MKDAFFIDKYKPILFKDFEDDNKTIHLLKTMIKINNLNIMFIGPSGCGKTTILNILIREYYLETDDDYERNILRINNLKEHGINYFRTDVKTFCQTCSSIKNKKKILVLDDIDLINEQSQQVFRNCIDKYSHNVNFISSCNNNQKVIESIQSRMNIIKLEQFSQESIHKIMKKIIDKENLKITLESQDFIMKICNNTIKVLINYMEKFKLINEEITLDIAMNSCSNIIFYTLKDYIVFVKENKLMEAIKLLYLIYEKGYSSIDILDNLFLYIKFTDILNEDDKYKIIPLICKYITIFYNINEDQIELCLFTNEVVQLLND